MQKSKSSSRKKTTNTTASSIKTKKNEIKIGMTICHKYTLTKFINEGSFGRIYVAHNTATDVDYAAKIEVLRNSDPKFYETLIREAKILFEMKGQLGFPKMIYFLKDAKHSFMILTLLGENLEDLFNLCKKKFSLYTVLFCAIQMISRLEALHSEGYVHRDIKPDNFLFGLHEKNEIVHLIDFGLSKKFLDNEGNHIPLKKNMSMVGTPRYTSVHSHLGYEHSRRDDLESLGYILIMFIKGNLPWMNLKCENHSEKQKKIAEIKMTTSNEDLCEGLPKEFLNYMNHTKNLSFTDKPNYVYLRNMFVDLMKKMFPGEKYLLDWMKLNDYKDKLQLVRKDTDKRKNVHISKQLVPEEKKEEDFNKKFLAPQKSLQIERISHPLSPVRQTNKSLDRFDSSLSRSKYPLSSEDDDSKDIRPMTKELNAIDEKSSSSNSVYVNDDGDKNEKKEFNEFQDKFMEKKNGSESPGSLSPKSKHFLGNKCNTRCTSENSKRSENISQTILNEYVSCNETLSTFMVRLKPNKMKFLNEI